jgi:exopolysaccharide biosynthesis polyprenyl glycosylphosphotransferase
MRAPVSVIMRLLPAADTLLLAAILAAAWSDSVPTGFELLALLLVVPYTVFVLGAFSIYRSQRLEGIGGVSRQILAAQLTSAVTFGLPLLAAGGLHRLSLFGLYFASGTLALLLERGLPYLFLQVIRRRGFDTRAVCVIGSWEAAAASESRFSLRPEWGLRVACVGLGPPERRTFVRYPGREPLADSLETLLRTEVVDEVLVAVATDELPREQRTLAACEAHGVLGRVLLHVGAAELGQPHVALFNGENTITFGMVPGDGPGAIWKRVLDVALGSALLALFSPVLILAGLVVKLSSPGPVLFKQRRAGLHGRPFLLYKFRTMLDGAEGMVHSLAKRSVTGGPAFKDRADVRITPVGYYLRRFSIDELPQLVNVVRGDMSLVGPRPLPLHEAAAIDGAHRRRFAMRPGLTCLWQVNGRSDVGFSQWMRYDLEYVDGWSLWLDAKLLAKTVPAVLSGKGAY